MFNYNIINDVDSYKIGMWVQYPKNTQKVYSYIESRGGEFKHLVFFGLQYVLKNYISKKVTMENVEKSKIRAEMHGEIFNYEGWKYIATELDGKLPIHIKALPEGSVVSPKTVMLTIENTDEKCYWLTTHLETMLLRAIWFPTTVASISYKIKGLILAHLEKNGTPEEINFKLHDFGGRGAHCFESASIGGLGHLTNFMGTDTFSSLDFAEQFYNMSTQELFGYSVPATEHSISTSWGPEKEDKYVINQAEKSIEKGYKIFSVVADTYNVYKFVDMLGTTLKDWVINYIGGNGAKLVVRPDSGDPTVVPIEIIQKLMGYFGHTVNAKGYKVLPKYLGVLQGDGIDYDTIKIILEKMDALGISSDCIVFGMGGALLGSARRDDAKFAMKASNVHIGGQSFAIAKQPITDMGKVSKKGEFTVKLNEDGSFETVAKNDQDIDMLQSVFKDGELLIDWAFAQVKSNRDVSERLRVMKEAKAWKNSR